MSGFAVTGQYGVCTVCRHRQAADAGGLCRACHHVATYKPEEARALAVGRAVKMLRSTTGLIEWPWPRLAELTGPLVLGQVTYVVAISGGGKTTFSYDLVRRWVTSGVGVTVMPLEIKEEDWRLGLAASECNMTAGDVWELIARQRHGDLDAMKRLKRVEEAVQAQYDLAGPYGARLATTSDATVTIAGLDRALALARSQEHPVVLVDHIDHISDDRDPITGVQRQGVAASFAAQDALLEFAKSNRVHVVAMSQANLSMTRNEKNRLLQYRPLDRSHILFPLKKVTNASQIIGLYRPISRHITRETLNLARCGAIEPQDALAQDRMGINVMKARHRGKNEGKRIEFRFAQGQLHDLTVGEQDDDLVQAKLELSNPRTDKKWTSTVQSTLTHGE